MNRVILEHKRSRDGLRSGLKVLQLDEKPYLFRWLSTAMSKMTLVSSSVHPKNVPRLADADRRVLAADAKASGMLVTALVMNKKGFGRAMACGIRHLRMSSSVSSSHSLKTLNARQARHCRAVLNCCLSFDGERIEVWSFLRQGR